MSMEELSAMADRFSALPLYFMKFHGGSDIDDVVDVSLRDALSYIGCIFNQIFERLISPKLSMMI